MGNMAGTLDTINEDPPAPITATCNGLETETISVTSSFFDTPIQKPVQDYTGHLNILKKMSDKKKHNDHLFAHFSVNSKNSKDTKKPSKIKSHSKKKTSSAAHPKEDDASEAIRDGADECKFVNKCPIDPEDCVDPGWL